MSSIREDSGATHPLSLKAFRVTFPRLSQTRVVMPLVPMKSETCNDSHAEALNRALLDNLAVRTVSSSHTTEIGDDASCTESLGYLPFVLSEALQVTHAPETILLGQLLSLYLCITNDGLHGSQNAQNVNIRVEIKSHTQSHILCDTTALSTGASVIPPASKTEASKLLLAEPPVKPLASIEASGGTYGFVVKHEIKEIGVHELVFTVQYAVGLQTRGLRRVFRYQALNPLNVKTKSHNAPDGSALLEVQLQNTANAALHLHSVKFVSSPQFNCSSYTEGESVFSLTGEPQNCKTFLARDTRQYLFHLRPQDSKNSAHRSISQLGKLDLEWRTAIGGRGHLQTSQLARKLPANDPIRLYVVAKPEMAVAEQPFPVICLLEVINSVFNPLSLLSTLKYVNAVNAASNQNAAPISVEGVGESSKAQWVLQGAKTELKYMMLRGVNDVKVPPFKPLNQISAHAETLTESVSAAILMLEWVPLVAGVQKYPPLNLVESSSNLMVKQFGTLGQVLVHSREQDPEKQLEALAGQSNAVRDLYARISSQYFA